MWTKLLKSTCFSVPAKDTVYIEADAETAERVFANRFGFSPYEEKCACCGMAYIPHGEYYTLQEATADERGCELIANEDGVFLEEPFLRFDGSLSEYQTLDSYLGETNIALIYENHITESDLEEFDPGCSEMQWNHNVYDYEIEDWEEQ